MKLDELKEQWAAHDKKLDLNIRINAELVREASLRKTNSVLQRLSRSIVIEMLINLGAVILLGNFIADHFTAVKFVVPAVALDAMMIFQVVFAGRQLTMLKDLDFGEPIVLNQKKLGTLRVQRICVSMWTMLLSPLLWVPLLIVVLKGLLGVDAYTAFDPGYLVFNFLFGLAVIPLILWISKRYADRLQGYPFIQRLMNDIAGRNLTSAIAFMDNLSSFEQETDRN